MFCVTCGNELDEVEKFCTECGNTTTPEESVTEIVSEERWWHRLGIVIYITVHLPLLIIVPLVWSSNAEYYSSYSNTYRGSDGDAFWYSVLTIIIYIGVIRLMKMAVKYITKGIKPKWRDVLYF
jgi:ABC-type uncharacterized transport system fused permease/ATPase subunit